MKNNIIVLQFIVDPSSDQISFKNRIQPFVYNIIEQFGLFEMNPMGAWHGLIIL